MRLRFRLCWCLSQETQRGVNNFLQNFSIGTSCPKHWDAIQEVFSCCGFIGVVFVVSDLTRGFYGDRGTGSRFFQIFLNFFRACVFRPGNPLLLEPAPFTLAPFPDGCVVCRAMRALLRQTALVSASVSLIFFCSCERHKPGNFPTQSTSKPARPGTRDRAINISMELSIRLQLLSGRRHSFSLLPRRN